MFKQAHITEHVRECCAACRAQIEVWASSEEDFRAWDGWVHSRLRQLVLRVELFVLVRPWPKARLMPVTICRERGLSTIH